jgi:hypothetical protein
LFWDVPRTNDFFNTLLGACVHIPKQSLRAISEALNHGASVSARSFWVRLLDRLCLKPLREQRLSRRMGLN